MELERPTGLEEAVTLHRDLLSSFVVTDPELPDSINAALVLAGLEGLLVVAPGRESWAREIGFERRHDLRGRFRSRVGLYLWAFAELCPRCAEASAASNEPAWNRPESVDLIVKDRLFAFALASFERGGPRDLGKSILLFLAAGPWVLRNCVFSLRLDAPLRALALRLLSIGAPQTLLPTFMASNFSFHSGLPAKAALSQAHIDPSTVQLERDKVYLTFTLSDGDQCALMNTAELGGLPA